MSRDIPLTHVPGHDSCYDDGSVPRCRCSTARSVGLPRTRQGEARQGPSPVRAGAEQAWSCARRTCVYESSAGSGLERVELHRRHAAPLPGDVDRLDGAGARGPAPARIVRRRRRRLRKTLTDVPTWRRKRESALTTLSPSPAAGEAHMKRRVLLSGAVALITVAAAAVADRRQRRRAAHPVGLEPGLDRRLHRRGQHAAVRRPTGSSTPAPATPAARPTGAPARSRPTPTAPRNLALDGAGNLRITPIRDGTGSWTSARIETQRTNFKPPAGGVLRIEGRIQMPNVTGAAGRSATGRRSGRSARRTGATTRTGRASASSTSWRTSTGINSVWGVLHCGVAPGRAVQRVQRHRRQPRLPGLDAASRAFHTYRFEWDAQRQPAAAALVRRRPAVPHRHARARSASRTGPT